MKKKTGGSNTPGGLPINLENLIHHRIIENDRLVFKSGWNEKIKESVIRSICAFDIYK